MDQNKDKKIEFIDKFKSFFIQTYKTLSCKKHVFIMYPSIFEDNFVKIINAHKVNNPDVTGAGDTVISTLSLAYTKYNDIVKAAEVANAAASIVVGKKGTATTSTAEIQSLLGE